MKKRRQAERERRELDDILRETKDLDVSLFVFDVFDLIFIVVLIGS